MKTITFLDHIFAPEYSQLFKANYLCKSCGCRLVGFYENDKDLNLFLRKTYIGILNLQTFELTKSGLIQNIKYTDYSCSSFSIIDILDD